MLGEQAGAKTAVVEGLDRDVFLGRKGGGDAGALADHHPGRFDPDGRISHMGGGERDGHEQVGALGRRGGDGAVGDVVGVAVRTAGDAYGEDGPFVQHAFRQGDAAAVVRIDRERRHRDRVVLLGVIDDVLLRQRVAPVQSAAFADVELGRPMARLRELVAAQAEFGHRLADLGGDGGVGRQELIELQRVFLVLVPEPGAAGGIGGAPTVGLADEAHREHLPDAVVGVEFVAWQRIQVPRKGGVRVFQEIASDQFETGRVVGLRRREGRAIGGVLRQAEAEAIDHHRLLARVVISLAHGRDEGEGETVGVETVDRHELLRVLASGEALAEFVAALAAEMPDDAGFGQQVAFVGGVDEGLGRMEAN